MTVDGRKGRTVESTRDIAAVLGFEQNSWFNKKWLFSMAADINVGFSSMFAYCNLVTNRTSSLEINKCRYYVLFKSKANTVIPVTKTCPNPLYRSVGIENFETVEIVISGQTGRGVQFEYGHSVCTLQLRPNHSIYY